MDIRQVTSDYFVAPQIDPNELTAIAQTGIKTVICNRPNSEVPPSHQAEMVAQAAQAAGITFHHLPLTQQTMTPENAAKHAEIIEASEGPVLAYCASGTRSTVVWCLGHAQSLGVDYVLSAAGQAGYDLNGLRPTLAALGSE